VDPRIDSLWETEVLPTLADYTRIECLSPGFDDHWAERGEIDRAAQLMADWCAARPVPGLTVGIRRLPGRTPVLVAEVPGPGPTVVIYGHLDKQPPLGQWRDGLGPFEPVRDGDRLYGRGTADDGYAVFCALSALQLVPEPPHTVVLIEASEESGSPDLAAHLDELDLDPALMICLDSGALSYDRLWLTTSLRGIVVAAVTVEVLTEGVHSGMAGGAVPSSFRLLRQLLSRLEDETSGRMLVPELFGPTPADHGPRVALELPTVPGLVVADDGLFRRSWEPALEVTGMDGIPALRDAGNVLRPSTTAQLSIRVAPSADAAAAGRAVSEALRRPVEGARVTVEVEAVGQGWVAPEPARWLAGALDEAGHDLFGQAPVAYGEGGSIPFLAMLGQRYPDVQFVALGVLGPASNAHGPNEFLHVPTAKRLTGVVAHLLAAARAREDTGAG